MFLTKNGENSFKRSAIYDRADFMLIFRLQR